MPKRRGEVFLATKIFPRKSDEAMRVVEASLKRLQTDHVDLLHVHGLEHDDDLRAIEAPGGLLKLVYKLRDQKVALAAGITSHADPATLKTAIERHDFDCVQMALNAGLTGMKNSTTGFGVNPMDQLNSFESVVLPVAVRKNMGIIAMKVFAQDYLVGKASADKLLGYSFRSRSQRLRSVYRIGICYRRISKRHATSGHYRKQKCASFLTRSRRTKWRSNIFCGSMWMREARGPRTGTRANVPRACTKTGQYAPVQHNFGGPVQRATRRWRK